MTSPVEPATSGTPIHLAAAVGAPCPTAVVDTTELPPGPAGLDAILHAARRRLVAAGHADVLKIALFAQPREAGVDFRYRFVQVLPGAVDRFDLRGSCGHSILATAAVAAREGWIAPLRPGGRIAVRVLNNGDEVVCQVDEAAPGIEFTVTFFTPGEPLLGDLLPTGAPAELLRDVPVSLVASGNPYAFVDARALGVETRAQLFRDDPRLYERLVAVREAAAVRLGLPTDGAFPKVAAITGFEPGRLAVRALAVGKWHPTLALTGSVCLGVATAIAGTVPNAIAVAAGCAPGAATIDTPGASTAVRACTTGPAPQDRLRWTSVAGKRVVLGDSLHLDLPLLAA